MRILPILFLLLCQVNRAQPESLVRDTKKLYEAFDTIDIDALKELLCTTDPEASAELLDLWFQNEATKFRFVNTNAKYTYEKVPETGIYAIMFRNVVRITYFNKIDHTHELEKLKRQFSAQTITYDPLRNAFLITYMAKMHAIPQHDGWRFAFADSTVPKGLHHGCIGTESISK